MKKNSLGAFILAAWLGCFILFALNIVQFVMSMPFVSDVDLRIRLWIECVVQSAAIVGIMLYGSFFVHFLSLQRSYAMKAASIFAVAAIGLFLVSGCFYLELGVDQLRLCLVKTPSHCGFSGWRDVLSDWSSFYSDVVSKGRLISLLGSVFVLVFFMSLKALSLNKQNSEIRHTSTVGLIGSCLSVTWMVCGAVWFFAIYPELLCNLKHGEISSEGFDLTVTIAYSVQSVLGALAYLFLLVFFTMQFRHRRWMANELCHGIDGRAPRFKFWIAFVAMVVAICTVYAIFYENGFFETLKISVKPKAQRIDSQIDFGWVKFFVLHAITCAYCTLAVAREYKMRLRDLNLSEKIYRLIFFVHLIPFVNIAAVVIEAVFLGGQKGIESGNKLKPVAVNQKSFAVSSTGATARLEELESLKNAGLISSEEYSDKRKEILSGV